MRRAGTPVTTLLLLALLAACSGNGSVSLPTSQPSVSVPAVALPSLTGPSRTAPTLTLPTATVPTTPVETVTKTETRTETRTATQTATQTAVQTETRTATETRTRTATVTQTATATATPSPSETATPTPEAVPTAAPTGGTTWWPWLLLALVVLGAGAWFLLQRRRAQVQVRAWDERLAAAEQEASWVEDSLTPQVLSRTSTAEAQSIWTAAQPRLLETDATFHTLTTSAPDAARAGHATDVRELLRTLVEAVGVDLAAPADGGPDQFRARRAVVDSARGRLRTTLGAASGSNPSEPGERR